MRRYETKRAETVSLHADEESIQRSLSLTSLTTSADLSLGHSVHTVTVGKKSVATSTATATATASEDSFGLFHSPSDKREPQDSELESTGVILLAEQAQQQARQSLLTKYLKLMLSDRNSNHVDLAGVGLRDDDLKQV